MAYCTIEKRDADCESATVYIQRTEYGELLSLRVVRKLYRYCIDCYKFCFDSDAFHVRRSRGEMYSGHGRLCVCLSVPRRIPAVLHGPGCKLGE